jgi:hypothetical protein
MAQYSTDFSEYTLEAQPSDWTKKWNTTNQDFTVEDAENPGQGYVLRTYNTSVDRCGLAWDDVGEVADCEILAKVKSNDASFYSAFIVARGGGSEGSEESIHLRFTVDKLKLGGYGNSFSDVSLISVSDHTWYWVRLQVSGTSVKARAWIDGEIEPSTWQAEVTETNLTSGWVGVAQYQSSSYYDGWIDWFSVGTGTDSAPEPALGNVQASQARVQVLAASATEPKAQVSQVRVQILYTKPSGLEPESLEVINTLTEAEVLRLLRALESHVINELEEVFTGLMPLDSWVENEIERVLFITYTVFPNNLETVNELPEASFKSFYTQNLETINEIKKASFVLHPLNMEVINVLSETEVMEGLYPENLKTVNELSPGTFQIESQNRPITIIF